MFVTTTGSTITVEIGTDVSKASVGRDIVTGAADGVGVCAEAALLSSNEAVTARVTLFQLA
jgi:hypothetical protein